MSASIAPNVIWALGTAFSDLDLPSALRVIAERPAGAPFEYVCTPNTVHVVNYDRGEAGFRAGVDGAWLRLCDSRVMARLLQASFGLDLPLAIGSDLTCRLLDTTIAPDDPICVIGGDEVLAARLRSQFGLRRLYLHTPPFGFVRNPEAMAACVRFVQDHPSRFVFLACGAPQSELLGLAIKQAGGAVGTGLCIGSSLLFATGLAVRAPQIWQRAGLEWLHRLLQEPGRMSRRLVHSQLPLLRLIARYRLSTRLRTSQGRAAVSDPP